MKNVIFNVVQSNVKGGLENMYLDYSKILNKNFELICIISKNFVHLEELKRLGIKTEILNTKGHYDVLSVIKFFFLTRRYSPKLIIAHNGRSFSVINLYNSFIKKKKFKTVAISHGGNPKRLVGFDYIITVAKHITQNVKEKYKSFPQKKIFTIHNGIEINQNYKLENKSKNKDFTFGTLSRLSPEKNIVTAIKAFKLFIRDVDNAKLLITGDGPKLCSLTKLVEQENLQNHVSFIGYVEDREVFFDKIDVLLHPATKEPFGLVILEAFNYYVPVIGVNSGGLKEIIRHKFNGYLYDNPSSHQSLYKAMHDYYFNKIKDRTEIVGNARKVLEESFSIKNTENKLLLLISKIISGSPL